MWICEDCDWEGGWPEWAQQEVEKLQSFIEVPYCPECGSYNVIDDPTADYEIIAVSKDSIDKQNKRIEP